eukprot:5201143-Ditylum_brightwellii.AAC.1
MVMIGPSLSATSAKSERSKSKKKHAEKNMSSIEGISKKEKCEASISSVENSVTFATEVDRDSIHVPMFIGLGVEEEQVSAPLIQVCLDSGKKPSKHSSPKKMEFILDDNEEMYTPNDDDELYLNLGIETSENMSPNNINASSAENDEIKQVPTGTIGQDHSNGPEETRDDKKEIKQGPTSTAGQSHSNGPEETRDDKKKIEQGPTSTSGQIHSNDPEDTRDDSKEIKQGPTGTIGQAHSDGPEETSDYKKEIKE